MISISPSALASHILVPVILEAALRALFAAVAVWAGLRLLGVANVLVQKATWGLVLVAALALPLAPRWQILPASAAFRLPPLPRSLNWSPAPNAAPPSTPTPAPDRYPAPSISKVEFDDTEVSEPLASPVADASASSSEPASPPLPEISEPRSGLQEASRTGLKGAGFRSKGTSRTALKGTGFSPKGTSRTALKSASFRSKGTSRIALKGTGFSPYIIAAKRSRALAPEGPQLQSNPLPIPIPAATATSSTAAPRPAPIPLAAFAWLLYLGIFAALLLRLLFGLASALRLWLTAEPVTALPAIDSATALRLRSSARVSSPVNIGSGIILPAGYAQWDEEKLRIVLAHERSHIRQGDFYLQLIASLYASLFWFSPLGWWLKRKLNELGEAISDRAGLEEAASRSSYAQILLEFAALPRPTLTGVAMARTSHLSQRIERLLNESSFRQAFAAGRRRALLAVLLVPVALFAATALVRVEAAAAPAAQTQTAAQAQSTPQQVTDQAGTAVADPAPAAVPAAAPGQPAPPDAAIAPTPAPEPGPAADPAPRTPQTIVVAPNPPMAPVPGEAQQPPLPPDSPIVLNMKGMGKDEIFEKGQIAVAIAQAKMSAGPIYLYLHDGDPYAVVGDPGTHVRFSGDWDGDRVQDVEKARKVAHGHFLLFQHEGKTYVVDDPAIVSQVEELNKPIDDLDNQMHALGKQMKEFGEQQREAARKMRETTIQTPDLSKEIAELNAAVASLQSKQGTTITQKDLGELQRQIGQIQGRLGALQGKFEMEQFHVDMGKFGEQQGKLGGEMGKLGAQIGQTARENETKMKGIITDSLSNGKAKPVE